MAVLFVAAVWFIYAAEAETAQGDVIDVRTLYASFWFTLFIASIIFLAVFVVFQSAHDGPERRRVAPVLLLYILLYVLLILLSFPLNPFDAGMLLPLAASLGFGLGFGVAVGGVLNLLRGIYRRLKRRGAPREHLRAEERPSQLSEVKDQSVSPVRTEEGELPSRHLWQDVKNVSLALGAQLHLFWQRRRLRAEERRAEERRRAEEQRRAEELSVAVQLARRLERAQYMSGPQFEAFVAEVLRASGHQATVLGGSGDQGVDVIAVRNDQRIAIQCKNHAKRVGNKPVQEVFAGARHHNCRHAWVVAPAGFTKGAFELAATTGVSLFDENGLRAWIKEVDHRAATQGNDGAPKKKVSAINGRIVSDHEAYDALLDKFEQQLSVLAKLHATRGQHKASYEQDRSLAREWSTTYEQMTSNIKDVLIKLDTLEGRTPDLATDQRIARRAELAARREQIENDEVSEPSGMDDHIRKLAELRDAGVLSEEEFEAKRNQLLDRM